MAWIRKRGRSFDVTWREGGIQRSARLRDRRIAEVVLREKQALEESSRGSEAAQDGPALRDRFLAGLRTAGRAEATLRAYRRRLDHWLAYCGEVPPARWTRAMLDRYLAQQPGWGAARLRMVKAVLALLVKKARGMGLYVPDFTAGLEVPPPPVKKHRVLTVREMDALMAAVRNRRYEPAVALAIYAGLSKADILTLTWGEVDLEKGWIVRAEGRHKTGQPLRALVLPELADVLLRHRPLHPVGRVCARLPEDLDSVGPNRALRRLFRRARLDVPSGEGFHLLRHGYGTMLMRAGVPQRVIGLLLSHAPKSAETAIYQHPENEDIVKAMEALKVYMATERAKA